MSDDTYLAVFLGSRDNPKMAAWMAMPPSERLAKQREGIAAWKAWVAKHQGAIVEQGRACDVLGAPCEERTKAFLSAVI